MTRHNSFLRLVLPVGALLALAGPARAFHLTTHEATANRTLDQLKTAITTGSGDDTLVFQVKGKTLQLKISAKEAYRAILDNPDFYRAGVVGPDWFPDIVTGQFWQHSNENTTGADLVQALTAQTIKRCKPGTPEPCIHDDHPALDPTETRKGSSEERAVDYAMAMFDFLQHGNYPFAAGERAQALAFVMGYLSHGVGDSFAHAWVNRIAGGAWLLTDGSGIFGPATEEIKHIAIEALVNSRVPGALENADGSLDGEFDRMNIRAPVAFLDAFFSRSIPNAIPYGNNNGDLKDFFKFYAQVDRPYGSALYSYFNGQLAIAQALKKFSRLSGFMNFAAKWQPGPFENQLLDILDFPDQLQNEIENWVGGDLLPLFTGGFIKCELFANEHTGLQILREVWAYLGGFNARIAHYEEKARVVRANWLRLSECTAQNVIRLHGGKFDPAFPTKNRDACNVLAQRPFQDQGDPLGLFRGAIRRSTEGGNEQDDAFLLELTNAFAGIGDNGILHRAKSLEEDNEHRHLDANILREKSYLMGVAVLLDDLKDIIITGPLDLDLQHSCQLVRDPAEHHCLNLELLPLALAVRQVQCVAKDAACLGDKVKQCLSGLCKTGCSGLDLCLEGICVGLSGPCDSACDLGHDACIAAGDAFCNSLHICLNPLPVGPCGEIASFAPECKALLHPLCDRLLGGDPSCASDLFHCFDCSFDALKLIFLQEGWADEILGPFEKFCDVYDEVRAVFSRFDTVEKRRAFVEQLGVPLDRIDQIMEINGRLFDDFVGFGPEYFVNATFILEDLRSDPGYLAQYNTALQQFVQQNNLLPDGDLKRLRQAAAAKLTAVRDAANNSSISSPLLIDVQLPAQVRALESDINAFVTLAEVALSDPASAADNVADFSKKLDKFEADTAALPNSDLKTARQQFAANARAWLTQAQDVLLHHPDQPVPPLIRASLNPLFDFIEQQLLEIEELIKSLVVPSVAGPTATRILRDVGPDMPTTFNQFFNAVQGMKIVPVSAQSDIERLFTQETVAVDRLPWRLATPAASANCKSTSTTNLYCDVMKSFDDPDCFGPRGTGCDKNAASSWGSATDATPLAAPLNWIPARGVVAFNDYDPTGKTPGNVVTNFAVASSQDAYDKLYTRIFDVPSQTPPATGFEGNRPWTTTGPGTISTDPTDRTQGNNSLKLVGCGNTPITSPTFSTTDFEVIGNQLSFDIKLPTAQSNPNWLGQAQLYVTIPGAALNNVFIGAKELTPLQPTGQWYTLDFAVPANVQAAFLGVFANVQFTIVVNVGSCLGPIHIDNLRFTGTLQRRTAFKQPIQPISPSNLFGFETLSDYTSSPPRLARETTKKTQGNASLAVVNATGYTAITSRRFANAEAGTIRSKLRVDLFIPNPQPNPYWGGDVQAFLTCPSLGLQNRWLGTIPLSYLFQDEFNSLTMALPSDVVTTLKTRTYNDCSFTLALNVSPGSGTFFFDDLGFVD